MSHVHPASQSEQIFTIADEAYAPFLFVMTASMARHHQSRVPVELTVLSLGLSDKTMSLVEQACAGSAVSLVWKSPSPHIRRTLASVGLEAKNYYKLFLDEFLPEHTNKALYLDLDILLCADIVELLAIDLGHAAIAACQDYLPTVADGIKNHCELGLDPMSPYFNSGVMLVDIARWRAAEAASATLQVCARNFNHLTVNRFPQHDQYGLNVVLQGKWNLLPRAWNVGSWVTDEPAKLIHYMGRAKPWEKNCAAQHREVFFDYLRDTPWANNRSKVNQSIT